MADATKKPEPTASAKAPVPAATPVVPAATPVVPAATPVVAAKPVAAPQRKISKPVAKKPATVAAAKVLETVAAATPNLAAPTAAPAAKKDSIMDIKNTAETISTKAQAMFGGANDRSKEALDKGQKLFAEVNDFSKGNIEAIVESSKIAAKGIEAMGQDAAAYAKKSFEEATAAAKTLASVKSPTEFMRLQSDYIRTAFDQFVAHSSRSTETMLKLAGEVAQPISNRVSLAAEKVKVAA